MQLFTTKQLLLPHAHFGLQSDTPLETHTKNRFLGHRWGFLLMVGWQSLGWIIFTTKRVVTNTTRELLHLWAFIAATKIVHSTWSFVKEWMETWTVFCFQMPIKCPNSGGQVRGQEAAVQRTLHLVRSSFLYPSAIMVRIQCSTSFLAFILHIAALNTDHDSCLPEVKPHPMKTIYRLNLMQFILQNAILMPACWCNLHSLQHCSHTSPTGSVGRYHMNRPAT